MVGHTGVMEAAIQACEAVNQCAKEVIETALANHYTTILIADHGNCETMINPDGSPNTAHTTNPVPIILIDPDRTAINSGVLGDVAPTILEIMGLKKPTSMTGVSLL
jgi:2,3-bisphosphoglycerate-independent phosphoglycerate mutase